MIVKSTFVDQAVQEYIIAQTVREHPVLAALREETSHHSDAQMEIGPEQGAFMQLLARAIGAKRYLEIGVFTGYSSLAMAQAIPDDGRIVACDVSEEYTAVARRYWERAGVAHKIDLRIAPALDTIAALESAHVEPFDMAFIDADKTNVDSYYEAALRLVRPGGLILVDNVLWSGRVLDGRESDASTAALRALNAKAGRDERVDVSLVAMCDGILVARKRS
jgi:predicted O-methyltransferase YrrM